MAYFLFIITAIVSFGMGWHWGYGHGRQIGIILGRRQVKFFEANLK